MNLDFVYLLFTYIIYKYANVHKMGRKVYTVEKIISKEKSGIMQEATGLIIKYKFLF